VLDENDLATIYNNVLPYILKINEKEEKKIRKIL
jgi:hypothetical protein